MRRSIWRGRNAEFDLVRAIADDAADDVVASEARAPTIQLLGLAIGACADAGVIARRRRKTTEADEAAAAGERWIDVLRSLIARARTEGGAGPLQEAILATTEAEMGRARDSPTPDAWADAAERWVALSHPFQTAYARLRLAEASLQDDGDRAETMRLLRAAHETAARIGAEPLRAEIEAVARDARIDLGDDGVEEPTADHRVAPANLTPRERDVLRLVAAGHTNREIGDRLFISEKTVSVHVSNAMAKLDALSRYEAAATAERSGLL